MKIIIVFALLFSSSLALGVVSVPSSLENKVQRPNILVIMAEDMSSKVGSFGDPVSHTPNLDQLALEGVRFTNVFTTAGVCGPSRAAHITGMHQVSFGAQHMRSGNFTGQRYLAVHHPRLKLVQSYCAATGIIHLLTENWTTNLVGLCRAVDLSPYGTTMGRVPIGDRETRTNHFTG
ncbi:MAG: hypothetical protein ACI92E_001408 [Oceanicoccus sp.]|jgi:hypothetical protein